MATKPSRWRITAWSLWYSLLCLGLLSVGIETAIHFSGPPIDGPFQLYNALRRIAAGQHVGTDFQFFHGAGVPYLHYLPFRLFGGGFFASEIARQVVSAVLFAITFVIVFFAWTRDWVATMRMSVAGTLAMIGLGLGAVYLPVNSLLGVRTTMPILFAAVLTLSLPSVRRSIFAGIVLGCALLLGTEQGTAAIAAFVVAQAVFALRTRRWRPAAQETTLTVAIGFITYALVVLILARGLAGLRGAVTYNFRLVPMDQFWYFGGPPNRFMSRLSQLVELRYFGPWAMAMLFIMIAVLVRLWRTPAGQEDRRRLGEAVLGIYGALSMASVLGVLVVVYLEPSVRIGIILILLTLWREANRIPLVRSPNDLWRKWRGGAGVLAALVFTMFVGFDALQRTVLAPLHIVTSHIVAGDPPTFSRPWRDAIATGQRVVDEFTAREHRKPVVWSTYSTMLEANNGMFHPSFDYIIHALGPDNRRAYQEAFATTHPDIVQTLKPSYAVYEEWLESNDWPMYRDLLSNYQIVAQTEWSYFWERRDAPSLGVRVIAAGPVQPDQHRADLNVVAAPDTLTLLQVRMRYHVVNPWRRVPVVGALPRYIVEISGSSNRNAISLAPYETERTFPVMVRGPSTVTLQFSTIALAGPARLVVDSLQISELGIPPGTAVWARNFGAPRANSIPLR